MPYALGIYPYPREAIKEQPHMPSDTAQTAAVTATPNTIEELLAIFEAVAPSIPSIVNAAATGEGGLTKIVNVGALLVNALSNVHSALSTALPAA